MSTLLEYDRYAKNPANAINNELHTLVASGTNIILPEYGSMYWDTISVVIGSTGEKILSTDSRLSQFYFDDELSAITGKVVVFGIVVNIDGVSGEALVSGQYVGGDEGRPNAAMLALADAINAAISSGIKWENVKHPDTFTVERHFHPITKVSELEELIGYAKDMSDGFRNNSRMGKTGNVLSSRIDRIVGLVSELQNTVNRVSAGIINGIGTDDIEELQVLIDQTMETAVYNAEVVVDNSVRLASLESAFREVVEFIGTKFEELAGDIDVVAGTDYYDSLLTDSLKILGVFNSSQYLDYISGYANTYTPGFTVTSQPYGSLITNTVDSPDYLYNGIFTIGLSCTEKIYFEIAIVVDINTTSSYTARFGLGLPIPYMLSSNGSVSGGINGYLAYENPYSFAYAHQRPTNEVVSPSTGDILTESGTIAVGVTFDPATGEITAIALPNTGEGTSNTQVSTVTYNTTDTLDICIGFVDLLGSPDVGVKFITEPGSFSNPTGIPAGCVPATSVNTSLLAFNIENSAAYS